MIIIAKLDHLEILTNMAVDFRNSLQKNLPTYEEFKEGIENLIHSNDAEFLLFKNKAEEFCGYVLIRYYYSMWIPGYESRIEDLYVLDSSCGKGPGKVLTEAAIKRAKEKGSKSVYLDTNENNTTSNKIYQSLGFDCISKRWKGKQIFYRLSLVDKKE